MDEPINQPPKTSSTVRPEFIRLPKPGSQCQHTGLSRAVMWQLTVSGLVKSVCLRRKGSKRGVRLINYPSLLAYLDSQTDPVAGVKRGGTVALGTAVH